ncbi:AraC family transcriptional regulator [Paenibacillus cymbidii]|uniref:AraC family transcriptional regulator n=1 Tax=Paenibacillus cymbidii TaxID=1639034 RepID=UPI0010800DC6|nr:AraC family transcriptional regulator [Paenibacillus cymbidii]
MIRKPDGFDSQKLFIQPDYMLKELDRSDLTRSLHVGDIGCFPSARYHYRERKDGCDTPIFIYCAEGEGWIVLPGDRTFRVAEGQLAVIPAGVPHRYGASAEDPWTIYWFHLQGDHAGQLISLYGLDAGPAPLPLGTRSRWLEGFEQMYALLTDKTYSVPVQAHAAQIARHMVSTAGLTAGRTAQDKKRERYLEQAIRYMTDRLSDSVTLSGLARHTGVSKQHLIHLFNRETGCPPIEYFLRMKIRRAGQLLDLTDLSIKEISAVVGLSDPYYFSRLFKKVMGCSPTTYRKIPKG